VLIYPFCLFRAKKLGAIVNSEQLSGWNELKRIAKDSNGTVFEIFEKRGAIYDSSALSQAGKWVFSNRASDCDISELLLNVNKTSN
jgi:hypothetical protein